MAHAKKAVLVVFVFLGHVATTTTPQNPFLTMISTPSPTHSAVIAAPFHGRFGDTLLAVAHTLYVAFKNSCEMLYTPFEHANQLVMHDVFRHYTPEIEGQFQHKFIFNSSTQQAILHAPTEHTLITVPYFTESLTYPRGNFYTDWDDPTFKELLTTVIAPKKPLTLTIPPRGRISVAVHVRKGGSFEAWPDELQHSYHFYKIPRNEFYIEQIKLLFELLDRQALYVFLFTDDEHPERLAHLFKKAIRNPLITIDFRKENNHHNTNVLEDFFSMSRFDVLVRGDSNFSIMAEKIGDHTIIVSTGDFKAGLQVQAGAIKIKKSLAALRTKYLPLHQ